MNEQKIILLTGATDGIGLATAKKFAEMGHKLILHGRNKEKLNKIEGELKTLSPEIDLTCYTADFSQLADVEKMAQILLKNHSHIDVLINNAGVFKTPKTQTEQGFDTRFVVNTLSPYLLTQKLLKVFKPESRIINLSSAAQATVQKEALLGKVQLNDFEAYAQSKLAITMWSRYLALQYKEGPLVIAVNPGSLLGSKMVREGFGTQGKDINIGANILVDLSLNEKYKTDSGKYFDNDSGQFAAPHEDALNNDLSKEVVDTIEKILKNKSL